MHLGCAGQLRMCTVVMHILALSHARINQKGARRYARRHILPCRFANFSITLNDICPVGLNDQPAFRENTVHFRALVTYSWPCAF
jgi:hypothetical protein